MDPEALARDFESHRGYLHAMAYRMLGTHADADDAVQETWLRLARADAEGIVELRGWLTTVVGRVCLDALRRHGTRRERPLELDLGISADTAPAAGVDPAEEALLGESIGLALYVVMDKLTPAERVAFVLHDVFGVPFDQVGATLDRSTAAAKMLASRARSRLRLGEPSALVDGSIDADRTVIDAFFAAARSGDIEGLIGVLAPDVQMHSRLLDGRSTSVRGASEVANNAAMFASSAARLHPALVDGVPGVLITVDSRPVTVMAFTVVEGRITAIRGVTHPVRLAQIVPSWVT